MFLNHHQLQHSLGVDPEIGKFFVDRQVPENNMYWKGRYLYLNAVPGYMFIPVYADLMFRLGVPKKVILEEKICSIAEDILDSAARQEFSDSPFEEHIRECAGLVKPYVKNVEFFEMLNRHFENNALAGDYPLGSGFVSLNRADSYLYILATIELEKTQLLKLLDAWYAMITYYLLVDDLKDIREDFQENQPNVILEAGMDEAAVERLENMMEQCIEVMNSLNPIFAERIKSRKQTMDFREIIRKFREENRG